MSPNIACVTALTADNNIVENSGILANIMIAAWRSAFRGILEDTVIEQYTGFENCKAMFTQILTSGEGTIYLASLDSKPMGLLCWLGESRDAARIEGLLTCPEAWGKGVGAALMERALSDIKAAGYSSVHVWPFAENHRARRFYEKQGFHPTGQTRMGDAPEMEYVYFFSCHGNGLPR